MVENVDVPQQEETKVESPIVEGFQEARERVLLESAEVGKVYRAMRKPEVWDVYNAWVKNMDVVANSYSWGKDKTAFQTRLLKVTNRIVGVAAAAFSVPEMFVDSLTWIPRQLPIIGHFIPDHFLRRLQIRMAESAKNEALMLRGFTKVVGKPFEATGEALQSLTLAASANSPVERFAGKISTKILYPKSQ